MGGGNQSMLSQDGGWREKTSQLLGENGFPVVASRPSDAS
jgi:hypothetical protein